MEINFMYLNKPVPKSFWMSYDAPVKYSLF